MQTAAIILEWYVAIGFTVLLAGVAMDLWKRRTLIGPVDGAFIVVAWLFLFVIVWKMWRRGELE